MIVASSTPRSLRLGGPLLLQRSQHAQHVPVARRAVGQVGRFEADPDRRVHVEVATDAARDAGPLPAATSCPRPRASTGARSARPRAGREIADLAGASVDRIAAVAASAGRRTGSRVARGHGADSGVVLGHRRARPNLRQSGRELVDAAPEDVDRRLAGTCRSSAPGSGAPDRVTRPCRPGRSGPRRVCTCCKRLPPAWLTRLRSSTRTSHSSSRKPRSSSAESASAVPDDRRDESDVLGDRAEEVEVVVLGEHQRVDDFDAAEHLEHQRPFARPGRSRAPCRRSTRASRTPPVASDRARRQGPCRAPSARR